MKTRHDGIAKSFRREFADWRLWWARAVVIAVAGLAGLSIVGFTWLTERALHLFFQMQAAWWWAPLAWTPLCTCAIVWVTRRYVPGAAGSGIPQVIATLEPSTNAADRPLFVSMKLAMAKATAPKPAASSAMRGLSSSRRTGFSTVT